MRISISDPEFKQRVEAAEYFDLRDTPHGVVGLWNFIYTTGICVGIGDIAYVYRYCYGTRLEAAGALGDWERRGYEGEPAGYIKRKGDGGDKRPDYQPEDGELNT